MEKNIEGDLKSKRVLLLGVSYRSEISDTRYSPVEPFYDYLLSKGAKIFLHDPFVNFWEEKNIKVSSDLYHLLSINIDIIAICTNHNYYVNNDKLIKSISKNKISFVLDTVGVLDQKEINYLKINSVVKVIGRGDV